MIDTKIMSTLSYDDRSQSHDSKLAIYKYWINVNRNYSAILATLQITSYALGV
jgi:hypothetical protein